MTGDKTQYPSFRSHFWPRTRDGRLGLAALVVLFALVEPPCSISLRTGSSPQSWGSLFSTPIFRSSTSRSSVCSCGFTGGASDVEPWVVATSLIFGYLLLTLLLGLYANRRLTIDMEDFFSMVGRPASW